MPLRGEAREPTYLNLSSIGQGASLTHRAHHALFNRDVIQKTVPRSALAPDAIAEHEPQLLEQIEHRCIPRIYEAQFDPEREGYVTFVMSVVGTSSAGPVVLGQELPLSVGECASVGLDLLSALEYLHVVKGVVHRDIKPDNVRLSADRRQAWLIDLNLAGRLDTEGAVRGVITPMQWMAPEVPSTQRYTVQSELYSLGVMLYELLRGRELSADYPLERIEWRLNQGRRGYPDSHYRRWPAHVPRTIRKVLAKAMHGSTDRRWRTAGDMRDALAGSVFVDWRQDPANASRWTGGWPSNRSPTEQVQVEVVIYMVRGGQHKSRRRARARYRPNDNWRRLPGLPDRSLDSEADLDQYFDDIDRRIARLRPAP